MVDENGGMLNDPVLLKLEEDRYWFSIADSDLLYWIKGLAYGFKLNVKVREPDVSPLGIQGPKAEDLMAQIVGDQIKNFPFFNLKRFNFNSLDLLIARSGIQNKVALKSTSKIASWANVSGTYFLKLVQIWM